MIRFDCVNLKGLDSSSLPPPQRTDKARALFLSVTFLGFKNYHEVLKKYAEQNEAIDAVFVEMHRPAWMAILGKSIPGLKGWDQHAYRYLRMFRWQMTRWLKGPLPIDRFDVIHVITQGFAGSVVDFADRPTKWAVNLDATANQLIDTYGYPPAAMQPMINWENRIYEKSDLMVCRNRWCSNSLRADHNIDDKRIAVCRNSMKLPMENRQAHAKRVSSEKVRIVFVGNDFDRKGGPELLKIHQQNFKDVAELHICSRRAKPDHSLPSVVWHGGVSRKKLLEELLPTMDVFVMPTRNDMHPWAIMEAAAIGLPVISTNFAGIPEMVIDGETGYLCGLADWGQVSERLGSLISNPDLRWEMGIAAREHIGRNYDPDDSFGGLVDRLVDLGMESRST